MRMAAAVDRHLAEPEVRIDLIDRLAVAQQHEFQIVEERVFDRPQSLVGEIQHEPVVAPVGGRFGRADFLAVGQGDRLERQAVARPIDLGLKDDARLLDVGLDPHVADERRSDAFEPNRLPDAGGARVAAALALLAVRLLAGGLESAAGVVEGVDDDRVVARLQQVGHVEAERGAAAGVLPGRLAVDPHGGLPIAGADVQPHAGRLPIGRLLEGAAIPDVLDEARASQARQLALAAEGHDDLIRVSLVGEPRGVFRVVGLGELPRAVQIEPLGPLHLRHRVFGPRQRGGRGICADGDRHSHQTEMQQAATARQTHFMARLLGKVKAGAMGR